MEHKKRIGQQRNFLNEPYLTSLTSHIAYTVSVKSYTEQLKQEGLYDHDHIEFSISDCSKNIHLDFQIDTKEDMRNSLYKLDMIINTCQAMKKDLKIARKDIIIGKKRFNELREQGKI